MASVRLSQAWPSDMRGHRGGKSRGLAGWGQAEEIKGNQVFAVSWLFWIISGLSSSAFAHNLYFFTTIQMWQNVNVKTAYAVGARIIPRAQDLETKVEAEKRWLRHPLSTPHASRRTETLGKSPNQGKQGSCLGLKFAFSGVRGQCACATSLENIK